MALFPTRILVGVTASEGSRQALAAADQIARASGSELHLVHVKVDDPKLRSRPTSPAGRATMSEEGQTLLDRIRSEAADAGMSVAGTHLRAGERVDRALMHAQEEMEAGLLVVGAGRTGSVGRRLAGTAAIRGGRTAPGSVLVVRHPD